jgi:hypothetical protein
VSFVAMLLVLAFLGPFLVVPAAVAVTALLAARRSDRRRTVAPESPGP